MGSNHTALNCMWIEERKEEQTALVGNSRKAGKGLLCVIPVQYFWKVKKSFSVTLNTIGHIYIQFSSGVPWKPKALWYTNGLHFSLLVKGNISKCAVFAFRRYGNFHTFRLSGRFTFCSALQQVLVGVAGMFHFLLPVVSCANNDWRSGIAGYVGPPFFQVLLDRG